MITTDGSVHYFGDGTGGINYSTDFGHLGYYAMVNGYSSSLEKPSDLGTWLNNQGFNLNSSCSGIGGDCVYLSGTGSSNSFVGLDMTVGKVIPNEQSLTQLGYLMMVRGEN